MSLAQVTVEGVAGGVAVPVSGAVTTAPTLAETELAETNIGAAAAITATLAAGGAGKRTFLSGFIVDGLGATAASVIEVTVTGILGGTLRFKLTIPAGAAVAITRLFVAFTRPIPANADNTAIVVNVPTFGAGNTSAIVSAHGFSR